MPRSNDPADHDHPVVGHFLAGAGVGGAEVYAAMLAEARVREGLPSQIVVFDGQGPLSERFPSDVPVRYLGYRRETIRQPLAFCTSIIRGYRTLERAVAEDGIDVIQTHLPNTHFWGLLLAMRKRCRVVFTIHNNNFMPTRGGTRLGSWIKKHAYRLILKHGDSVVAVSEEVKVSLLDTLGMKEEECRPIEVVANGVLIPDPLPAETRAALREGFSVEENEFWLLAAGRLTEAKNFQCLVAAVGLLRDRGVHLRVLIAGEGHLRTALEEQVRDLNLSDRIELPGNLSNLGDLMQAADLLAMPSRWEGLPLVLLEAMARGLPAVGTRIKGLVDVVTEGTHGLLVDVDDADGLAAAIGRLVADPALRQEMGRNSLDLVSEKYHFDRVYAELDAIYNRVMD